MMLSPFSTYVAPRQDVAVAVPDGITTVSFGGVDQPVVGNVAVIRKAPRGEAYLATGPAEQRTLVSPAPPEGFTDAQPGGRRLGVAVVDRPRPSNRPLPNSLRFLGKDARLAGTFGTDRIWLDGTSGGFVVWRLPLQSGGTFGASITRPTKRLPFVGSPHFAASRIQGTARFTWFGLVADGYDQLTIGDASSRVRNNVALVTATVPQGRLTVMASGPAGRVSVDFWAATYPTRVRLNGAASRAPVPIPAPAPPTPTPEPRSAPTPPPPAQPSPAPTPASPAPNP